jgi:hypothetical protein
LFWLGWTAHPSVHPAVPASSGLLFGGGTAMIFVAMINYLSDAYRQHAAPAQAAASTARSLVAVGLPLAAPPLYEGLGVRWACSLLGVVMLGLTAVPFAFIRHGAVLRSRSPFCQKLTMLEGPDLATAEQDLVPRQRPVGKEMTASERENRMIA